MVRECDRAACWDEPVFRYLLGVELERARRAARALFVLVVDAGGSLGASDDRIGRPGAEAGGLAATLARCLRESDLVGWHRADRRAAALLTETAVDPDTARVVATKVLRSLGAALPADLARKLRVRIYRYGAPGARIGFHRLFAASGAGEAMGPAVGRGIPVPRKAVAVAGTRLAGTSVAKRTGQVARQAPGAASAASRLAEGPVSGPAAGMTAP